MLRLFLRYITVLLIFNIGACYAQFNPTNELILDKQAQRKLTELQSKNLSDSFLKGRYKLYDGKVLASELGVDLSKFKKFTIEEIKQKIKNNGSLPLISPLFFQQNIGQSKSDYPFILQSDRYALGLDATGFSAFAVKQKKQNGLSAGQPPSGNRIWLRFIGSQGKELTGRKAMDTRISHVKGKAKSKQTLNIPGFSYLANDELYPGVKLLYEAKQQTFEYMFMLEPETNPEIIKIRVDGIKQLKLSKKGQLIMQTSGGPITQTKPRFFELENAVQKELSGEFVILSKNEYGFKVNNWNRHHRLVIDPEISFVTYFGGAGNELGELYADDAGSGGRGSAQLDVKFGSDGNLFVIGSTTSADFPTTNSTEFVANKDVFILRIDPTLPTGQNLIYATILGGSAFDEGNSIDVSSDGHAFICGISRSPDFPTTTNALQPSLQGSNTNAFVGKLSPSGDLEIGTFLGNGSYDPSRIVFRQNETDTSGGVYIAGSVFAIQTPSMATEGSFQTRCSGGVFDGFVAKMNNNLNTFSYFTYLGGRDRDVIMDLDVVDGYAFVTGNTMSKDFPTTALAFQTTHSEQNNSQCDNIGGNDFGQGRKCTEAFVARLNQDGSSLIYSTLYGEPNRADFTYGISVNEQKQAFVTGVFISMVDTGTDMFVTKFEAGGENILWTYNQPVSTGDRAERIVVENDQVHVTGLTETDGLSTGTGANGYWGGEKDIFYLRISANEGQLNYFTYLGGEGLDRGFAIDASQQCVTIAGTTRSANIETVNPTIGGSTWNGQSDLLLYTLCDIDDQTPSILKDAPPSVSRGELMTYAISVINPNESIINVEVRDEIPSVINVTPGSISLTAGPGSSCSQNPLNPNQISCNINAVSGGNLILITGRVRQNLVNCQPVNINNVATLQYGNIVRTDNASTLVNCVDRTPPGARSRCGNGRRELGEECDGGPKCRSNCTLIRCGDGIVDRREECDDGNNNNSDRCRNCECFDLRGDICSTTDECRCESGFSCYQKFIGVVQCDWWDIFREAGCSEALFEAYSKCNPSK